MDLFHKIMELVDKNSGNIPEGDYLELCDTIQELREQVKPPSFLDQSIPMWRYDETNHENTLVYEPTRTRQPPEWVDDSLPSDPDTAAQRDREQFHQQWRERSGDEEDRYPGLNEFLQWREGNGDEEDRYPGLNEFLQELHEEWSDPVEPGAYYPPPRQSMQDGTTVAEVKIEDETITAGEALGHLRECI
jgi:hypothetical protein